MRKGTAEAGGELTKSGGPIGSSDKGRTLEVVLGQLGCAGTIQIARRAQAHADTTSLNSNPRHINNPPRHRTHSRARPHHTQYALRKSHSGSPAPGLKRQEKSQLLMSARLFSVISPAKYGRLGPLYFWEVDLWLLKGRFCALSATFHHFPSL